MSPLSFFPKMGFLYRNVVFGLGVESMDVCGTAWKPRVWVFCGLTYRLRNRRVVAFEIDVVLSGRRRFRVFSGMGWFSVD